MIRDTRHTSRLFGGAENSARILGVQQLFRLCYSLHRILIRLVPLLTEKSYWTLKREPQIVGGKIR